MAAVNLDAFGVDHGRAKYCMFPSRITGQYPVSVDLLGRMLAAGLLFPTVFLHEFLRSAHIVIGQFVHTATLPTGRWKESRIDPKLTLLGIVLPIHIECYGSPIWRSEHRSVTSSRDPRKAEIPAIFLGCFDRDQDNPLDARQE